MPTDAPPACSSASLPRDVMLSCAVACCGVATAAVPKPAPARRSGSYAPPPRAPTHTYRHNRLPTAATHQVDTDLDDGPEATDVEDSDAEPSVPAGPVVMAPPAAEPVVLLPESLALAVAPADAGTPPAAAPGGAAVLHGQPPSGAAGAAGDGGGSVVLQQAAAGAGVGGGMGTGPGAAAEGHGDVEMGEAAGA